MKTLLVGFVAYLVLFVGPVLAQEAHGLSSHAVVVDDKKAPPEFVAALSAPVTLAQDSETKFVVQVKDKSGVAITDEKLSVVHTQKMHALLIDGAMVDYQHAHPAYDAQAGGFVVTFAPKTAGPYRVWLNFTPFDMKEQMVFVDTADGWVPSVAQTITNTSSLPDTGLTANLSETLGLRIYDAGLQPVARLEPVMGAYAHFVAFSSDGQRVLHLHPTGPEPQKETDRGGPDLAFMPENPVPGFYKAFAQVRIDGKDLFFPFGIEFYKQEAPKPF